MRHLAVVTTPSELAPRVTTDPQVALISLTTFCNAYCAFCCVLDILNQPALNPSDERIYDAIRKAREEGCRTLSFTGGEPTVHPKFAEFCSFGRELGYEAITINTNGIQFKSEKFTRKAVEGGLKNIDFSVHGHTAELHDELVGRAGAFDALVKGARHLRELRDEFSLVLGATTVVTARNGPHLAEIAALLIDLGFRSLRFKHCFEGATGSDTQQVPSYEPLIEPLRQAVRLAHRHRVGVQLTHFPICLLGEEAVFCTDFTDESVLSITHKGEELEVGKVSLFRRTDTLPCERCSLASVCTKVDARYLAVHGDSLLRPVETPAALKSFLDAGLKRYQVGENLRRPLDRLAELAGAPALHRPDTTVWLQGECGRTCTVCDCRQHPVPTDATGVPDAVSQGTGGRLVLRGEPMRSLAFRATLEVARRQRWQEVWIRSHGEDLVLPEQAQELKNAGVYGVLVPLFATRSLVHDKVANHPNALVDALRALRMLDAAGLRLGVEIPLLSQRLAMPEAVLELAIRAVPSLEEARVYFPRSTQSAPLAAPDWDALAPSLARTFALAEHHKVRMVWRPHDAIPLCALPENVRAQVLEHGGAPLRMQGFEHRSACASCVLATACPGTSEVYRTGHGDRGLRSINASTAVSSRSS